MSIFLGGIDNTVIKIGDIVVDKLAVLFLELAPGCGFVRAVDGVLHVLKSAVELRLEV